MKILRDGPQTCGKQDCDSCNLNNEIMCRYGKKDSVLFLTLLLPFFTLFIIGAIKASMVLSLLLWFVCSFIFFVIIEPIILCRYCPYWGMEGKTLKCHANYGVFKLYKYKPEKAPRIMKILFAIFALTLMMSPVAILLIGGEYILASIGAVNIVSAIYICKRCVCTKCINFSCIMNSMDEELKAKYFEKNDELRKGYEK